MFFLCYKSSQPSLALKEGVFRKPTRPSLPLRKAPPLTPALSPQERGRKPPYSVLGTATLLGWRTIKGLRHGCAGWDRLNAMLPIPNLKSYLQESAKSKD